MDSKDALIVFEGTKIRRTWHDDEWFYSVSDIIAILTDSKDELAYWRKLKQRKPQLVTICHGLKLPTADGKLRYADCVNTRNAFRLIQSIPSLKARLNEEGVELYDKFVQLKLSFNLSFRLSFLNLKEILTW
ncbi:hypothetical protein METP3_00396 [Methanosarcinales archaeon]|nr:hypothetical protein METP3_00396 [Methanosarcinales archaeon]